MMTREMEFRMERAGLIQVGDQVRLKEDAANTMAGVMYYYTIRDAIAMSNNTKKKLNSLEGVVTKIEASESYWTVTVKIVELSRREDICQSEYRMICRQKKYWKKKIFSLWMRAVHSARRSDH